MGFGFGGNMLYSLMPALLGIAFIFAIVMLILTAVRGVRRWSRNNASPVLDVAARVAAKRADVRVQRHAHPGGQLGMDMTTRSTRYYITFEVAGGDRMELRVQDADYGMIAEGDRGWLKFQGTRFLGFQRS